MELPQLYKDTYELALGIFACTKSLPKHARPTLGRRLEENALELASQVRTMLLIRRNHSEVKNAHLEQAVRHTDELKLLVQLSRDLDVLTSSKFGDFSQQLEAIGSQLGGLSKHLASSCDAPI